MKSLIFCISISLFLFPLIVLAQDGYIDKLENMLTNIATVLYVMGGGIALIVIIVGGITYMTAGGAEDKTSNAKKIITNGLIGAAVVLCAGFILDLLTEFLAPLL